MKCERCGSRTATVRYAEVVDGSLTSWYLCEECASERGVTGSLTPLAGPLVNILMGLLEGGGEAELADNGPTCPSCGLTYGRFRRTGRLGCGTCYETFAFQLRPRLGGRPLPPQGDPEAQGRAYPGRAGRGLRAGRGAQRHHQIRGVRTREHGGGRCGRSRR